MARFFKHWIVPTVLLVAIGSLSLLLRPHWVVSWFANRFPDVLFSAETARPVVALTIDDSPDPDSTPLILDVLDRHRARATFFVITDRIAGNEELLARIVSAGHELGNHMTRDEPSYRLSISVFRTELRRADARLAKFGDVRWFRPGGGWFTREMVDAARQAGYRTALGSVYPFDATLPSPRFAAWYVSTQVRAGSVIVLHDGNARGRRTAAALDLILPALERQGFSVTTLSALAEIAERGARSGHLRRYSPLRCRAEGKKSRCPDPVGRPAPCLFREHSISTNRCMFGEVAS